MRRLNPRTKACLLVSALVLSSPLLNAPADASTADDYIWSSPVGHVSVRIVGNHRGPKDDALAARQPAAGTRNVARSSGISCVPYARELSGISVAGNAWQWWDNASGQYARGFRPEAGSVLTFRGNSRMRLGHVAVVRQVVNGREVIVDHANWPGTGVRGGVSRGVTVVDVSEANNWSAVRVQLSRTGDFGSVYPTYGFIYNRRDTGVMTAEVSHPTPQPAINRVPADLRPAAERPWRTVEEVAESSTRPQRRITVLVTPAHGN